MRVLVLGAGGPAGINFTRAIYEAGHETVAAEIDPVSLQVARGRYKELIAPDRPVQVLNDLIDKYDVGFVHAQPDPEVRYLSQVAHELNAPTMLANRAALFIAQDKYRTAIVAGPDAPETRLVSDGQPIGELIDELGGDCWLRLRTGAGSSGALPVSDASIAQAWIDHHRSQFGIEADEWVISERLPGKDLSYTGVWRDGKLLAFGIKERLRLHGSSRSPARVASTANLQVTIDRLDVRDVVYRVVEALPGPANGVMMFDLREDANGKPRLTEINCSRFGTTSYHFANTGVNLPAVLVEASRGEPMSGPRLVPSGVAWYRELDSGSQVVTL